MPVALCFLSSDFVSLQNKHTFGFMCVSHVVVTWWNSPKCQMQNFTCSGLVVANVSAFSYSN